MSDIKKIKSPCQSICIMTEDPISGMDYCIGCFRTVKEIQEWYDFTDEQRKTISNALLYRGNRYS